MSTIRWMGENYTSDRGRRDVTSPATTVATISDLEKASLFARDMSVFDPLAAAIERAAVNIMAEAADTFGHELRGALAARVVVDPTQYVQQFAWAVSTNNEVVTKWAAGDRESAFGDFQFAVNGVWNAIAGVVTVTTPA